MVSRATRNLSREQREMIEEAISEGRFRNMEEFEERAVQQAVAALRLRKLQQAASRRPHSPSEILREARAVRRAVAKRYEA